MKIFLSSIVIIALVVLGCTVIKTPRQHVTKTRVVFDTDANNEVDDQHAQAYLLFSGDRFTVRGITVNSTHNGGGINEQYAEAERVLALCNLSGKIPLLKGANAGYNEIKPALGAGNFDGAAAVNFIIEEANAGNNGLVVIAVGKLTNVALALQKAPAIAQKMKVVWLGSNYPEPGEYNQDNDTAAMNYVLRTNVPFEMVTVRGGNNTGTAAVRVTKEEINQHMPGKGPLVNRMITGRHDKAFNRFGNYSVNLFDHVSYYGNPPGRSLFDMAAVAIVKNLSWAGSKQIPAPVLQQNKWIEQPDNPRKITVWENFNRDLILADFYNTMEHYVLAERR